MAADLGLNHARFGASRHCSRLAMPSAQGQTPEMCGAGPGWHASPSVWRAFGVVSR